MPQLYDTYAQTLNPKPFYWKNIPQQDPDLAGHPTSLAKTPGFIAAIAVSMALATASSAEAKTAGSFVPT